MRELRTYFAWLACGPKVPVGWGAGVGCSIGTDRRSASHTRRGRVDGNAPGCSQANTLRLSIAEGYGKRLPGATNFTRWYEDVPRLLAARCPA